MSAVLQAADSVSPTIRVDDELRAHLVPLRPEELAKLEEAVLEDGIRTALVLWGDVLVDGHNRYALAAKHGLEFKTEQREFADRDAVLDWMDREQIGRRNVTPDQLRLLIGRLYNRHKGERGGDRKSNPQIEGMNSGETAEKVAAEAGVSRATVERAGKDAAAIDAAEPEVAAAVMRGDLPVRDAVEVARLDPEEQREVAAAPEPKEAAREKKAAKPRKPAKPPSLKARAKTFAGCVETLAKLNAQTTPPLIVQSLDEPTRAALATNLKTALILLTETEKSL